MKAELDERIGELLARWFQWIAPRSRAIVAGVLGLTLVLAVFAARNLGVNSDNVRLLADDVPSQIVLNEFAELFPILNNSLLVVVEGENQEQLREATAALADRLREQTESFSNVYIPGGGDFFERNLLLYRDAEELEAFGEQIARMQPILAELERDPSLANLAPMIRQGLEEFESGGDAGNWISILDQIGKATVAVHDVYPIAISWEQIMLRGSAFDPVQRQVIVLEPELDFESILPAGGAIAAIRNTADELELGIESGIRIRITGNPALNHEEMIGIAWDIGVAGIFCFLLVAVVLYFAFRSVHLTLASLVTLLIGLIWTTAFAAASVGGLTLISIAFAVLFIGLGVDFAIHLGLRYASLRRHGQSHIEALAESARDVGSSIVICTLTTATGFFVFVPTDYRGVAELGMISGTGMLIILLQTVTLFPALISSYLPISAEAASHPNAHFGAGFSRFLERHSRSVIAVGATLGIGALLIAPRVEFDPDVVKLRNPDTESVQAFEDLLDENDASSPWFANVLAPDLETAEEWKARFQELDAVGEVLTLRSYVPEDQDTKREILEDTAMLLFNPALDRPSETPRRSLDEQLTALRDLRDALASPELAQGASALAHSIAELHRKLTDFFERAEQQGSAPADLQQLEWSLVAGFPAVMKRLRRSLDPDDVTLDSLPEELVTRMLARDGRARVQIFPKNNLSEGDALEEFVATVYEVSPRATGLAVNMVEFGHTTVASLVQALASALAAITLLLWILWRRIRPVLLVLTPLLIAAATTVAAMVLLGLSFNFINVIVIPLLLGIGVDSAIHLVHRATAVETQPEGLLGTTTARAVFYSAITTIASFGSLSFSSHRGMSSLGSILVVGLILTLAANLVGLPAILARRS